LEAFFPEVFSDEEGSEGRAEALRKALIPPVLQVKREGADRGLSLLATQKELKDTRRLRIPANPSLFSSLVSLAYRLAARGYPARVRVVRFENLEPFKLLPPLLARALGEKVVRLELEVTLPSSFNRAR
jgi:hypothetical protein